MADEPENLTIRLLQELRAESEAFREEVKTRFDRIEAESATQSALLGKVLDATLKIAATQQIHGGRLNMIEARLAEIERETGLVKA